MVAVCATAVRNHRLRAGACRGSPGLEASGRGMEPGGIACRLWPLKNVIPSSRIMRCGKEEEKEAIRQREREGLKGDLGDVEEGEVGG
ncbi:hypothetical protein NDU88_000691 [Pleurodeles waltl]|uniref:Uncharacterized protein n=1 Tax=Pleurodeles waltl TaxID=8319 RepID=A0AAV7UQP6_PLEWA|nr:hypothetical protein NDU88_000691 [Pleurodeles waltl]